MSATQWQLEAADAGRAAELLIGAMRQLSRARSRDAVAAVVKTTARQLVGADGASFVLRDGTQCFYLDEDAISPLWKGQRFPLDACVSGWVMCHSEQVAMPDIYVDPRVPHAAYRPTFVKSLVMTPVRRSDPIAAIGIYWAEHHIATTRELELLQDLADTSAIALENAQVYEQLEQRVAQRTEELTQANHDLEAFAHTVAHDLRSPLNAIVGFAEVLDESGSSLPPERVQAFAHEIALAGRRMDGLIRALLEFAAAKRRDVHKTVVDLSALARSIAARLCTPDQAPPPLVTIADGLHGCVDAALIEVALTNLLSNALKYSSHAQPPRIELGQLEESDESATFYVRDNGVGFDRAAAARLFAPFQRLHAERDFPGHGIGLATVAAIIRRHGGRVWAESEPGAGATFYFSLPKH